MPIDVQREMFEAVNADTIETVGKFVILWNAFESHFYNSRCNAGAILSMQGAVFSKKTIELCSQLKAVLLRYKNTTTEAVKWLNCDDRKKDLKRIITDWLDGDFSKTAVIGVIYRIRCNAFHGVKAAITIENQIDMFSIINDILASILHDNNKTLIDGFEMK